MSHSLLPPNALKNQTIWVACSEKLLTELRTGLESMGANVIHFPVLQTKELDDKQLLDRALQSLKEYSWIIFTSAYGVHFFTKRLHKLGLYTNDLPPICAIGPATAAAVDESGFKTVLVAENHSAEGVLEALKHFCSGNLSSQRILIPRALKAREFLPAALTAAGCRVDVVPCYQTVGSGPNLEISHRIQQKKPDMIVFTSAATVKNMIEILGRDIFEIVSATITAGIGPITAQALASQGKSMDIVPKESTVAALLHAIGEYYSQA
jgi:uroporphyrinogen III methyltransferase / synthase